MTRMTVVADYDFAQSDGRWYAQIPWDSDLANLYWPEVTHISLVGRVRPAEGLNLDMWHPVADPRFAVIALPPFSFRPLRMLNRARSLARVLRSSDTVMLKMFYPSSVLAYIIARFVWKRPVVTVLVGDPQEAFIHRQDLISNDLVRQVGSRLIGRITRRLVNGSDVACFVSQALKGRFWNGGTTYIVANESWLKADAYLPARRLAVPPRSLLYVGRLSEPKGLPVLMEAFGLMSVEYPDLRLVIAGDGELGPAIRSAAVKDPRVEYAGWVKGQSADLYRLFRACDVLVLPSLNEGLPLVLLEAMANRTIVCSTDIGGVPEVVEDGKSGFLYQPGPAADLCEALRRVLSADRALLEAVADAAYQTAEANSYVNQRGALARTVKALVGRHKSTGS